MQLFHAIKHLHPEADPLRDFTLQDDSDGNGPYIAVWNLTAAQPTPSELGAAWAEISASLAWDPVRAARLPLLDAADIAINKAEDQGKDLTPLRTYRQALRDVTKGLNPDQPVWPPRPW